MTEEELEKITAVARKKIREDLAALFSSEEDMLYYEHFYIEGMIEAQHEAVTDYKKRLRDEFLRITKKYNMSLDDHWSLKVILKYINRVQ